MHDKRDGIHRSPVPRTGKILFSERAKPGYIDLLVEEPNGNPDRVFGLPAVGFSGVESGSGPLAHTAA